MTSIDILTAVPDRDWTVRHYRPTSEEERHIRDAMAYLVIRSPFFAHVLYNDTPLVYTLDVPWAATDGYVCMLNPKSLFEWDIPTVAFVIAHELAHKIFCDLFLMHKWRTEGFVTCSGGLTLPYDHEIMNKALDFRINAMLIEGKVGTFPPVGCYDPDLSAKGMESGVEIYEKLWNQNGGKGGGGGKIVIRIGGRGKGNGESFDIHIPMPQGKVDKHDQDKVDQLIAAAAIAAEASGQGSIPGAIQALIGDILEPKVSWQDHLKSSCLRSAGDPAYDWSRIDRRLLVRPTPQYFARPAYSGIGCAVVLYDTSRSCVNQETQRRFFSEMAGIVADLNPQRLVVIWCDATVQRVDDLEEPEDLIDLHFEINKLGGAPGGGGTDFRPAFDKVAELELEPELCVYLTDTYGTFPAHEPSYPVVWASIIKNPKVPWGDIVHVEL